MIFYIMHNMEGCMCSRQCHDAMHVWCSPIYCNLAQDKTLFGLWVLTVPTVHDVKHCECRWMHLQGLCPTAQSGPSWAGTLLLALQRRPAGRSPRILTRLLPGPCPVALGRALIRLQYKSLQLSSAGHLLTALESSPAAQLPPPRI